MWGPARDVRPCQPLLATWAPPPVPADPTVRLVRNHEVDLLFPAAVAMYTEEVGVSPLAGDGGRDYRERVTRSRARHAGRTPSSSAAAWCSRPNSPSSPGTPPRCRACGWRPEWRGHGVGTAAMAAVVRDALRRVAPSVSLYVNDYNTARPPGLRPVRLPPDGTFATVLL